VNVYLKTGLWLVVSLAATVAVAHYTVPDPLTHLEVVPNKAANDNVIVLPVQGCADTTVLRVAQNLKQHPEEWTLTDYELRRGMGWFDGPTLRIWISNADYGLDFNTSSNRFQLHGIDYPFTPQCRAYLYSVTQSFQAYAAQARVAQGRSQIEAAVKQ
jgi:hypothetical protein